MRIVPGSRRQASEVRAIGADGENIVRAVDGSRELNDTTGRRPGGKIIVFCREGTDRAVRQTQDTQTLFLLTQNAVEICLPFGEKLGNPLLEDPFVSSRLSDPSARTIMT